MTKRPDLHGRVRLSSGTATPSEAVAFFACLLTEYRLANVERQTMQMLARYEHVPQPSTEAAVERDGEGECAVRAMDPVVEEELGSD